MKKYDSLLKRVEQFERLAVYSDRRTFLKAIAAQQIKLTPLMKNNVLAIAGGLSWVEGAKSIIDKLTDLANADQVDADELSNTLNLANSKLPKDPNKVDVYTQKIWDISKYIGNAIQQAQTPSASTTTPVAPAAPASKAQVISREIQDQLNQILLPYEKIAIPIKTDGILGPETQKALDAFKQTYSRPATPANIKEIYLQVKHPELVTKPPF